MMPTQDLEAERRWWKGNGLARPGHLLMRWPFVHPARQERAYAVARANTRKALIDFLDGRVAERALVAPCGDDADQDIFRGTAKEFHGIDISPDALAACKHRHPEIQTKETDCRATGYPDGAFDLVGSILVFHHLHRIGFDGFLREFYRVLKPGGGLAILEPSSLSPFAALMTAGKAIFGNISGLVPDEAPLRPSRLSVAIEGAGFRVERFEGVSFTHNRVPVPIQRAAEVASAPFARTRLAHVAWMCLWLCRKP